MTIPFREWTNFDICTLEGSDHDGVDPFEVVGDWADTVRNYFKIGYSRLPLPWERFDAFVRPKDLQSFKSHTSLDTLLDAQIQVTLGKEEDEVACVTIDVTAGTTSDSNQWIAKLASGKYYDGENEWDSYPLATANLDSESITTATGFPYTTNVWLWSSVGGAVWANTKKADLFRNGFKLEVIPVVSAYADIMLSGHPLKIKVRYLNAIVNSLSRNFVGTSGGQSLILTGLGFDNDETELNENKDGAGVTFNDEIDYIYLEGTQGQGTVTLQRSLGDFAIDSNTQITISSMPAMLEGTYEIKLRKEAIAGGIGDVDSYAGDFYCDDSGRIREGIRMTLLVSDSFVEEDKLQPIPLMTWRFKDIEGNITTKNWSVIDTRALDTFYDGRLLNMSSLRRGININEGLFNVSDMTIQVSNADKEISILLASNFPKNQLVDIYFHWANRPHSRRQFINRCIIDDCDENGPVVSFILKDITRKYFAVDIPKYLCTEDEYPNIDDSAKGEPMPEILGLCSYTDASNPGANEALYIDTTTYTYLAARRILYDITEVYSAGVLKTGGGVDYEIYYRDGGRTYIEFTGDQGTNKITFNSKGYTWPDWDSANGYVQTPSYVLAFLMTFLAELPLEYLHLDSFDLLADNFEEAGYDENGHFNSQAQSTLDSVLSDMLFCYGCKGFPAQDGRFKVEKKKLSDFAASTLRLFDQIDLLNPAKKSGNLKKAVNFINALFDYYPGPGKYLESHSDLRQASIDTFEAELDGGGAFNFPWTNSLNLIKERIRDILSRRGFGEKIMKTTISIEHINDYDIFTDFKLQDPFALSLTGEGEAGHFYYIISMNYNWMQSTIDIEAIDLQWLLKGYFVLGDEDELASAWASAGLEDRMYAYLCDEITGKFSDGEEGKIFISETEA